MSPDWWALSTSEREAFHAAVIFLDNRLEERETFEWALTLAPEDRSKRLAIRDLLVSARRKDTNSPWLEAWHLVVESWSGPIVERNSSTGVYDVRQRLKFGERTKGIVSAIVDLVTPRLKVKMRKKEHVTNPSRFRKPKTVDDLISCTLTSGTILDIEVLQLEKIEDKDFLITLASALDDVIVSSLDLARRVGWDGEHNYWVIGQLHRVYYVSKKAEGGSPSDLDEFSDGIVPAVKLLYEVLARLVEVDLDSASSFIKRWDLTASQIHLRLLVALYRDQRIASQDDLDVFFPQLNDRQFWDLQRYPEIAELRAKRFNELNSQIQRRIVARIKKGPPRSHWPREIDSERVRGARLYNSVREMKRILLCGGHLTSKENLWLEEKLLDFPELGQMNEVDEDFPWAVKVRSIGPNPDHRFDAIEGEKRLAALEAALSTRRSWPFEEDGNATDWIQVLENCLHLISDFESVGDGGSKFIKVWEKFGCAHSPTTQREESKLRNIAFEADRVLSLLEKIDVATISSSIGGISHWISSWKRQIFENKKGCQVWFKIWPIAVIATNSEVSEDDIELNVVSQVAGDQEPRDLDTLNTPAGQLISVFFDGCPTLTKGVKPFAKGKPLRKMRDAIFTSDGRSLLIAQHRSVEFLSYFLQADQEWAQKYLTAPLKGEDSRAVVLWRSISRRIHPQKVLQIIGDEVISRAQDLRLGRESRSMLVRNLVIDCLHAFWKQRPPAVNFSKVQQLLRSVEDEVRLNGAEILQRFVRDSSNPQKSAEAPIPLPEDLYFRAIKPFFQEVWPQERSLATPGVSQALADLPATVGNAFTDAVDVIERFLVPFECWSLGDFGFYGVIDDQIKLKKIDSHEKASAFLRLLDKSIGTQENAVIPHELADALDQIRQVNPKLSETRPFRRLEAASRR